MNLDQYDSIFKAAGQEWNVDPTLLKAMASQESSGNPKAVSKAGAQGLMQIIPQTQAELGVTDPNDPTQSIYGGAKYLSQALDAEKTPEDALRYYHGGPDWRQRYGPESAAYAPAVTAHYRQLAAAAPKTATDATPAPVPAAPPYDDFLKRTGAATAPDAPVAPPDYAGFLARTGAAAVAPPEAPPSAPAPDLPIVSEYGDIANADKVTPGPTMLSATGDQIRNALAPAPNTTYGDVLPFAKDNTTGAIRLALPNMLRMPLQGLAAGPEAGVTINPATNALGLTPEAASVAPLAAGGIRFSGANALVREAPAMLTKPPPVTLEELNAAIARAGPEPAPVAPTPPAAPPGAPQSAGAAASRDLSPPGAIDLTPKQELAYRSTAEGQKLLEPQPVGRDTNAYVPGVQPNSAEIEQSVNTSRELKALNASAPDVSEEAKAIASANNEHRQRHFEQLAGSDVTVDNARAARAAQAETDLAATWANKQPADASPMIDMANAIKASPDGRRPLVRNAVDSVTKELTDSSGQMITDPEQLYGVRKHIDDLMSKEAGADDPKSVRALANLRAMKETLDGVIEQAAPGFGQYLKNFSEASGPIDTMTALQKFEPKLYDTQNRMQLSRVQSMMKQIVESRAAPGINPFKSIPDDTMAQLFALRDDLRRSASADELARTKGSDTAQNLGDIAKGYAKAGATVVAHGAANYLSPGFGSMALQGVQHVLRPITGARMARKQTARGMQLLHPDTPLKNLLTGPDLPPP